MKAIEAEGVVAQVVAKPAPIRRAHQGQNLVFTPQGMFADDQGAKLGRMQVNGKLGQLGWTHIYAGHGPQLTTETLESMAKTKGVSGKWNSDLVVLETVEEVGRLVGNGTIVPGPNFKIFPIQRQTSLNFRKTKDGDVQEFDAGQAKVGFKKQDDDSYALKTLFPYPDRSSTTVDEEPDDDDY